MFQGNSVLRRTFVYVGADPRSGHLWDQPSGLLKIRSVDRLFVPRSGIGSWPVDHTIGFTEERLNGLPVGPLRKLPQAVERRKSDGMLILIPTIINVEEP